MAKLEQADTEQGWPDVRGRIKDPRMGGTITIYRRRGRLIAQLSRQRPSPAALEASKPYRDWLKGAVLAWKYLHPALKETLQKAARKYHITARDFFIAMIAGSLFSITDEEGNTYYPLRARAYVGKALDLITNVPGALLVRGLEHWQGLIREGPGDLVLGWLEGEDLPRWVPMPSGGGGGGGSGGGSGSAWDLVIEPAPPSQGQGWEVFGTGVDEITWSNRGVTLFSNGRGGVAIGGVRIQLQSQRFRATTVMVGDIYSRTNYISALFGVMDNDTGRMETIGWAFFLDGIEVTRWNSVSSWNSNLTQITIGAGIGNRLCLTVEDDGTIRKYGYSISGKYWWWVRQHSSGEFVSNKTHLIIALNPQAQVPFGVTAIHYNIEAI